MWSSMVSPWGCLMVTVQIYSYEQSSASPCTPSLAAMPSARSDRVPAQHQVQVLHGRTRGAFAQVVEDGGQQQLVGGVLAQHGQAQLVGAVEGLGVEGLQGLGLVQAQQLDVAVAGVVAGQGLVQAGGGGAGGQLAQVQGHGQHDALPEGAV